MHKHTHTRTHTHIITHSRTHARTHARTRTRTHKRIRQVKVTKAATNFDEESSDMRSNTVGATFDITFNVGPHEGLVCGVCVYRERERELILGTLSISVERDSQSDMQV